jgi:ADP-ribosyl-[dinitrogen reductase] hydrolase
VELEVLVEWSKGSEERYALKEGRLVLAKRDRPAPVNYGFVPDLYNPADGEEVDAALLGPPVPPGSRVRARLRGLLHLADGDHKLLLGEGEGEEALQALLAWFPPERRPRLLDKAETQAFLEARLKERDRYLGSLLGLAVGDALGAQVEFRPKGSFPPVKGMEGGGPHGLFPGAWTDDTSLALCLAESLLEKGFDPRDQMARYLRWYREGYLSALGYCFDIGHATRRALERFQRTGDPFAGDEEAAGNGALMRLAPLALAYAKSPRLGELARLSARATHGAREALEAAEVLAWLIARALGGAPKEELLRMEPFREGLHPALARVVLGGFWEEPEKGPGYAPATLGAALWAFARSEDFAQGMLLAVNLGGDADTVGAVYGSLAGAYYGRSAIPEDWLKPLHLKERIEALALGLYRMSMASPRE